jgi:AmiR/NasT family two-component response regulator
MSQVTPIVGAQESGLSFVARITNAASLLVGNYNIAEQNAYKGLRHGRVNHMFELAGMLCQPRSEPLVRK